jgi:hypothetical protein
VLRTRAVHSHVPAQSVARLALVFALLLPSTPRYTLAQLYALVHCIGAHPCPSRSALVPLRLSVARLVVPPHLLSSPVPARILSACRDDLGPCA